MDNPPVLQDPPTDAAWAEFIVGFSAILASPQPASRSSPDCGTARKQRRRTSIRMLGWATFAIGALGSPIALVAGVFGTITCIFDGSVLLASSSPLSYRMPEGTTPPS